MILNRSALECDISALTCKLWLCKHYYKFLKFYYISDIGCLHNTSKVTVYYTKLHLIILWLEFLNLEFFSTLRLFEYSEFLTIFSSRALRQLTKTRNKTFIVPACFILKSIFNSIVLYLRVILFQGFSIFKCPSANSRESILLWVRTIKSS